MKVMFKKANKKDYKRIKKLFISAFPPEERPPFFILKSKAEKGKGDMLSIYDGEVFIGFVYIVCRLDTAYLFFFAIEADKRGCGYGSAVLVELLKEYEGKRLFLAREQLDENSDNYDERVRRHKFYLKNGFCDLPVKIKEGNVIYDVMGVGGSVTAEEYDLLITQWCGKFMRKFVDMRIIE